MQHRSGGGFDTPGRYTGLQLLCLTDCIEICPYFGVQLSDSGTPSKFGLRPLSIKRTNLQKSSTGKPAFDCPTVMSVERSAKKGQSPRLLTLLKRIRTHLDRNATNDVQWMEHDSRRFGCSSCIIVTFSIQRLEAVMRDVSQTKLLGYWSTSLLKLIIIDAIENWHLEPHKLIRHFRSFEGVTFTNTNNMDK